MSGATTDLRSLLLRNGLSSMVVFLVALPLCLGIAIASGAPPAAGLITGIVGGIVVGLLAGSPLLVSGPAAGLAVLVYELIQAHGLVGLGPVVVLAGAMQLVAGRLHLGVWFRSVSPGVVSGMLAGIGILIIASQLHVMLDASPLASGIDNFAALPERIWTALTVGDGAVAGLLGLATIALMIGWEKLRPGFLKSLPGALIAIVVVTLVAEIVRLPVARITLPDNLLGSITLIDGDALKMLVDPRLLLAAVVFAVIASAETLLSATAVDRMHDGERTRYDRELMAQGAGNLVCGALGALPMTGVIVRSAANVQAGATSRLSTILHGIWILAFVLMLPWLLRMTPVAGLAGILVLTGVKMINLKQLREFADYGRGAVAVFVVTALAIVVTDLLIGVSIGIGLSLLRLAVRAARLHVNLRPGEADQPWTLRLVGSATFLSVPRIARALDAVPENTGLAVDVSRLRYVDHACLMLLRDWARMAPASGRSLQIDPAEFEARAEAAGRRALVRALA